MTATPRDPSHRDAEALFADRRGDRPAPDDDEGSIDPGPTAVDEAASGDTAAHDKAVKDTATNDTAANDPDVGAGPAEKATDENDADEESTGFDQAAEPPSGPPEPPDRPEPPGRRLPPADADLIAATRVGDDDAYDELLRRHETAGQRLIGRLTSESDRAEVSLRDAADRALATLRSGSGPDVAFRSFFLRTILGLPTTRVWDVDADPTTDEIEFRLAQAIRGIDGFGGTIGPADGVDEPPGRSGEPDDTDVATDAPQPDTHTPPSNDATRDSDEDASRSAEDATVPGVERPDTVVDLPTASADDTPTVAGFEPATLVDLPAASADDTPTVAGFEPATPLPPADDPATDPAAAEAFGVLPESWQAALWHTEVEDDHPEHVGVLLGMSAADVAVASARARAAFRQSYARQHLDASWPPLCQDVIDRLSRFTFAGLYDDEAGQVAAHLQTCAACTALTQRLEDLDDDLRFVLAGTVLGDQALGYLEAVRQPPQDFAPLAPVAQAELDGRGTEAQPWPTRVADLGRRTWTERHVWLRQRSTGIAALGTLAAASVVVLAWATVAILTGGGLVPAGDEQPAKPGGGAGGPVVEDPDDQTDVADEVTPDESDVLPATVAPSVTDLPSTDITVRPTRESFDDDIPEHRRERDSREPGPRHSEPQQSPSRTPTPPRTPTSTPDPTPTDTEEPSPSNTPSPPEETPTSDPSPPPPPTPESPEPEPTPTPPREQTSPPPSTPSSDPPPSSPPPPDDAGAVASGATRSR